MRILCPVCNSDTSFVQRVYACGHCGHRYRQIRTDPVTWHDAEFRLAHQRIQGEVTAAGINDAFHLVRQELVNNRIELIKQFVRPDDHILDVGGGAGTFAHAIKRHVASAVISEVNSACVSAARHSGLEVITDPLQHMSKDRTYDVVFAWHVLEHCEPLLPAAQSLSALFRRYLIVEIPKERGAPERFDGHFHFFSDQSIQGLFRGLVIRFYVEGVQRPARLIVFERTRRDQQLFKKAVLQEDRAPAALKENIK